MGLPLFKTPAEPENTATTLEKSLANARSSIRRNRPCESRDHIRRYNSNSRRSLGIDAIFDSRAYDDEEEDEEDTRRRINRFYNSRNIDSPSALWNSRVIRIFNDNRERSRHEENVDSDHQYFPFYDSPSDYEPTEYSRADENTTIQSTQPRRPRMRRLRRMTGRHSLLSRPVLYSDSFPRLAPPTTILDTSSLTMDTRDQENDPTQIQAQDPGLEMNQIAVIRSRNQVSDTIQRSRPAVDTSTPVPSGPYTRDLWHENLHQSSYINRIINPLSDTVLDGPLDGIPENQPVMSGFLDSMNTSIRDSSPCLSETTVSDKFEGPQPNFDRMLEGRRDDEIESATLETSESRDFNRWRTYADVVATRNSIINQHDEMLSHRLDF